MLRTKLKTKQPGSRRFDSLTINFSSRKAKGNLTVYDFADEGHFVAYMPSLNLSAYGDTEKEARNRLLKVVLEDFLNNLTDLRPNEGIKELAKLGWAKERLFNKRFKSKSFVDKNGVLKNFNLSELTEIHETVVAKVEMPKLHNVHNFLAT